ncbi:MAG: methionine--tRNA ligase [Myxococcota bacterium]
MKYLVTPALPYANGPLHLGHMVEHVQVDVFVRALRMAGEDVAFVCGADSHGTPIEINAAKAGEDPASYVKSWQARHETTLARFGVMFDNGYGSTHTDLNRKHAEDIFNKLNAKVDIKVRDIDQLFDPQAGRFLPDRLIKGTCPKCQAPDQYGDSCEKCGSTYRPTELINPKSTLTGETPILKSSKHYFFELSKYADKLKAWTQKAGVLPAEVQNSLQGWFADGLKDWDISRDAPYFGFLIPGESDKYFYVWLDAPVGYISLSEAAGMLERWSDPDTKIIHFIGKDIVYFHTLFWPAMLMGAGYTLPSQIAVHGMLTVNGEKMSKSRGTFILADRYAEYLEPEALRYYLACKLSARIEDIDLSFEDFIGRVNADLVNKIINLISRTVPLLHKGYAGKPGALDLKIVSEVSAAAANIEQAYRLRDTMQVVRDVVQIADIANKYLQDNSPWDGKKNTPEQAHQQLSTALWAGKVCVGLLKPILPQVAEQTEKMLGLSAFTFANILTPLPTDQALATYTRLFERIDSKKVTQMLEIDQTPMSSRAPTRDPVPESLNITIDDFMKVDLRAALVVEAKAVEGSDKLIAVTLDVGPLGKRNVFSGLRPHIQPEELVGKIVMLVANLAPRKMKFGISEGMICAAGDVPKLVLATGANPGDQIR